MGFPANTNGIPMIAKGRQHTAYFGGYIQDDWKTSSKLTLNMGLRYELYTQPIDANNLGSEFDVTTGQFAIPGQTPYSRAMVHGDHNDWGPRIGFAYQAFPKWVVRGGYGVFYAMRDQNQQTTQFSGNTPNIPTIVVPHHHGRPHRNAAIHHEYPNQYCSCHGLASRLYCSESIFRPNQIPKHSIRAYAQVNAIQSRPAVSVESNASL